MGLFIVLEGIDGAGKTTQTRLLAGRLRAASGVPLLVLHEPGSTPLGETIRRLVKDPSVGSVSPLAELLLFAAARAQLIEERIVPYITDGGTVLCDRFSGSTLAYQGYGRGISLDLVRRVEAIATSGLQPDIVLLLDVDIDTGLERKRAEGGRDRFEEEERAFHKRVREGYLEIATGMGDRWTVIDGNGSPQEVAERLWAALAPLVTNDSAER